MYSSEEGCLNSLEHFISFLSIWMVCINFTWTKLRTLSKPFCVKLGITSCLGRIFWGLAGQVCQNTQKYRFVTINHTKFFGQADCPRIVCFTWEVCVRLSRYPVELKLLLSWRIQSSHFGFSLQLTILFSFCLIYRLTVFEGENSNNSIAFKALPLLSPLGGLVWLLFS